MAQSMDAIADISFYDRWEGHCLFWVAETMTSQFFLMVPNVIDVLDILSNWHL